MKIKTIIQKIIAWILIILSLPFLLVAIIDFITARDFIDIFIFITFFIPFMIGIKLVLSFKKATEVLPSIEHTTTQLPETKSTEYIPMNCSELIENPIVPQTIQLQNNPNVSSNTVLNQEIIFPDWYVSISFGKSTSDNYMKAVALAKAAPQYLEQFNDGKILHQAIYSSKPDEYLAFIMLYELVENWKSSFVIVNGQFVDRKVIKQLNYCYGDKCRSGNPNFCYGASYMTANPFGCHRLQISAYNNPWWSFYKQSDHKWILDKQSLLKRIDSYATVYSLCPLFNYEQIIKVLNQLPSSLSNAQYKKLMRDEGVSLESRKS